MTISPDRILSLLGFQKKPQHGTAKYIPNDKPFEEYKDALLFVLYIFAIVVLEFFIVLFLIKESELNQFAQPSYYLY